MSKIFKVFVLASIVIVTGCVQTQSIHEGGHSKAVSHNEQILSKKCEPYIAMIEKHASTGDITAYLDYMKVEGTEEYKECWRKYPKLSQALKNSNKQISKKNDTAIQKIKNKYNK